MRAFTHINVKENPSGMRLAAGAEIASKQVGNDYVHYPSGEPQAATQ